MHLKFGSQGRILESLRYKSTHRVKSCCEDVIDYPKSQQRNDDAEEYYSTGGGFVSVIIDIVDDEEVIKA